jgi:hypothetical protein
MYEQGTIGREELRFLHVVDSIDEATTLLQELLVGMWREARKDQDTPKWWFLEKRVNIGVKEESPA